MKKNGIKVVVLCGGLGTRLRDETEFKPKPMVKIGNYPILWHIMKIYSHFNYNDFLLCLGYRGDSIRQYFLNYKASVCDFTLSLGSRKSLKFHNDSPERWNISMIDTGEKSMTGSRLKKIQKYIDSDIFLMTYGDGLADIDIKKLVSFHLKHKKIATITGVFPQSRFGELEVDGDRVYAFTEKPQIQQGLINGGFFVLNKEVFDYLDLDDNCVFEKGPLETLAEKSQLMIYRHQGYWRCLDTYRDMEHLNKEWECPNPPWKIWRDKNER